MNELWYYYYENGKSIGPIDLTVLLDRIREGRVHSYQLVYRDGESEWRPALSFEELRVGLAKSRPVHSKQEWVILKNEGGKFSVESAGPFTAEEVRASLADGRARYTDYVWRDGMHRWRRISMIKEFQAEAREPITPPPLFDIGPPEEEVESSPAQTDLRDLLKTIDVVRRAPPEPVQDEKPQEAEGEDLAKTPPLPPPPPDRRRKKRTKSPAPPSAGETTGSRSISSTSLETKRQIPKWYAIAPIGLICVILAWKLGARINAIVFPPAPPIVMAPPPPPLPAPAPLPLAPLPPPLEPKTSAGEAKFVSLPPEPRPHPRPPHTATKIRLRVENRNGKFSKLHIETDAGPEQTIWVEIIGGAGQVVGDSHYYRRWKWNSSRPPVTDDQLPSGYFRAHVWSGSASSEEKFESGTQEKKFLESLRAQRKASSAEVWNERKQLYIQARRVARAIGRSKIDGAELDRLSAFRPMDHIFFELWSDLRDICKLAKSMDSATARDMIQQFQAKISQLSVWR